jgi:D-aminopeptidase
MSMEQWWNDTDRSKSLMTTLLLGHIQVSVSYLTGNTAFFADSKQFIPFTENISVYCEN